jgi:predicted amidophosphoribosyltransferase
LFGYTPKKQADYPLPTVRKLRGESRSVSRWVWQRLRASGLLSRPLQRSECLFCLAALQRDSPAGANSAGAHVCAACAADLPRPAPHACLQCAASINTPGRCGACLADPPAFDAAVAACVYAFPVSPVISQLKYGSRLALAGWMADALAEAVTQRGRIDVDWLLPLPLSRERIAERGFNQAALIAAVVTICCACATPRRRPASTMRNAGAM